MYTFFIWLPCYFKNTVFLSLSHGGNRSKKAHGLGLEHDLKLHCQRYCNENWKWFSMRQSLALAKLLYKNLLIVSIDCEQHALIPSHFHFSGHFLDETNHLQHDSSIKYSHYWQWNEGGEDLPEGSLLVFWMEIAPGENYWAFILVS